MSRRNQWKTACLIVLLCGAMAGSSSAQTFTNLATFDKTNGAAPYGNLVQGLDGKLYGVTTDIGTALPTGRVFKVTTEGTLTTVSTFAGGSYPDGVQPAGLALALNGNFYGTATWGGASKNCQAGCGTVFEATPSGGLTPLHLFAKSDGSHPSAGVVQGTNGNFYGTTFFGGGSLNCFSGCGTVFRITPAGTLTTLHVFIGTDGKYPEAALVQAIDGNFYGTTYDGGAHNFGTVFKITPSGTLTTLHSFTKNDGASPMGMVLATDGNFYGTTYHGGSSAYGTIFKITTGGTFTSLHSFNGSDGVDPLGVLVEATDGNFYGTTESGGSTQCLSGGVGPASNCGTVFEITAGGALTTLHNFDGSDGEYPASALVQATDGTLYGTTAGTGAPDCGSRCGTVFQLSMGLAPFVTTVPTSRPVGGRVRILGTDLTGATSVTFNGTAASFTVVSPTAITTTVPQGATTGTVRVTTPRGTLSSNVSFRVL
jgi:uncharacterized repeat protein (TIGR03803 family)